MVKAKHLRGNVYTYKGKNYYKIGIYLFTWEEAKRGRKRASRLL